MKRNGVLTLFLLVGSLAYGQIDSLKEAFSPIASRIFLPSVEIGYQLPNSSILEGSITAKTAVEYRFRNNNDFFLRLSLDTYGAQYRLEAVNNTTNNIEGTVQFRDWLLGPGYRMGDSTFRVVFGVMGGMKFYEFPTVDLRGNTFTISQMNRSLFSTTAFAVLEYYFDEKSAITLTLDSNQVWKNTDFWLDGRAAFGISLGFITSLL